jgi:tyrosine-protein kinase
MTDQSNTKTTLRDYLAVLRRRKWVVIQAVVIVPLVAFGLSRLQQPRFEASSLVLLKRQGLAATVTGSQDPNLLQDPAMLGRTQAQVAEVPALAERVVRSVGVPNHTASDLLASSRVEPVPQTDVVLRFSVDDRVPEVAARLATAYAYKYTQYRRELDTLAYDAARRQLEARMAKLRKQGVSTSSSLYSSLAEKAQTLVTLAALQVSNASVLRPATGAIQVQPKTKVDVALGLLIGVVLGLGAVFVLEALDRRVRADQDLGSLLALPPLLARLPAPPKQADAGELAMLARPTTAEAESFRLLRANLELANLEPKARTILVTSASGGEGKTTTVANLAIALARAGRRVALVDLDIREPMIARMFRLGRSAAGVTQVVLGDVALADALTRVPLAVVREMDSARPGGLSPGTLDVLPAGSPPPNPGEFVASSAVAGLLNDLADRVDVVLVDAPPLLAVSDSITLGSRVDAVLVVVRLNVTDREMLRELARALDACPCVKLGYVLTGAEPHEPYGYGGVHEEDAGAKAPDTPRGGSRRRTVEVLEPTAEAGSSNPRWV